MVDIIIIDRLINKFPIKNETGKMEKKKILKYFQNYFLILTLYFFIIKKSDVKLVAGDGFEPSTSRL